MLCEWNVCTAHNEPDDGLAQKSSDHHHLGPEVIDDKGTPNRPWQIEKVDDDGESKNDTEGVVVPGDTINDC